MSLLEQIKKDQLVARKTNQKIKKELLTTLIGEIETLQKKNGTVDVEAVLKKFKKNIDETMAALVGSGMKANYTAMYDSRFETAAIESQIIESYLPKQLSEEDLRIVIRDQVAAGAMNIGQIMGHLKKNYPNQFDGKLASQLARQCIAAADSFV